ncbi:Mu transposase C-terminal domain-containing protein [Chromobacterium haemolyticum]|uniref:Mu transposase C-terminal domain-containing protein n=1 Tax=Chromobacterium haemolyticum TaxID=394935 RepID=UPI001318DFCA|nr:Mu transposase C-terminal domain-containing protein [Chromobacterium haemolyticum]BBH15059.1 transposase [Chromobacterium haemolyticum]
MILANDLLSYSAAGEPLILRVLWIHPAKSIAFVIDVHSPTALPVMREYKALLADLSERRALLMDADPFLPVGQERSEKQKAVRDKAWGLISPLVNKTPAIFDRSKRGPLVAAVVAEGLATHRTLYGYLRRYWQRGQTPNALLPDYIKSGGKGKSRIGTGKKLGRPRKYGTSSGRGLAEGDLSIFRIALQRNYLKNKRFTIHSTYQDMLKEFYFTKVIDPDTGQVSHVDTSPDGLPTLRQFSYWLEKEGRQGIERKRRTPRVYDKDMRGLLGTSTAEVSGPGSRFQIDATIADVYLLSRCNRSRIIGRPVLYVVIDVFSRMIVGIYVGLEGPSWVGAMMALANTAGDKVAFCQQFNIEIGEADWPCHFLPGILLGDRGEIESRYIESLINNFAVIVENTAPYRADWKGIVEQRFHLLPAKFKAYTPGYIETDYAQRGGRDYRLDATLDIDQFTQVIIECVLYYNNSHLLERYDRTRQMIQDDVPAIPIDLWEWGIANCNGALRRWPEDRVRFCLLPVGTATVTTYGLKFLGSYYSCAKAIEAHWFDIARQRGRWSVEISYDPRFKDEIYLHDPDATAGYQVCYLTDRSRADKGMSVWECAQRQELEAQQANSGKQKQYQATADLASRIESIVADAEAQKPGSSESNKQRTSKIRQNRAEEKQAMRERERFMHAAPGMPEPAKVIPLRPDAPEDLAVPDITEILGSLKNDGGQDD